VNERDAAMNRFTADAMLSRHIIPALICRVPPVTVYPSARKSSVRSFSICAAASNGAWNSMVQYQAKTNCEPAKAIPPGAMIRRPLNLS
jgi:hypothetical protein